MKYFDKNGQGLACIDLIIPDERIIIECKRTYKREAEAQLLLLYAPLADWIWPGGDWRKIVAVKFWDGEPKPLIMNPFAAVPGLNYYIHWG